MGLSPTLDETRTQPQPTSLKLNADGLYEVEVQFLHSKALAGICGLTTHNIEQMVAEDNADWAQISTPDREINEAEESQPIGDHDVTFDPNLADELGSDRTWIERGPIECVFFYKLFN